MRMYSVHYVDRLSFPFPLQLSIIKVDELIDHLEAAAKSQTIPDISRFISQTSNPSFQVLIKQFTII